jgi:hypothetical protein
MADRKGFNGLRGSGLQLPSSIQAPIGSQMSQGERAKMIIAQQIRDMSQAIFIRKASGDCPFMAESQGPEIEEYYQALARHSDLAARSYFVGLGVITVEQPPESEQPEDGDE